MRAVVQRVKTASVLVDGHLCGNINKGLLILAAVHKDDTSDKVQWVADKCRKLRIFPDDEGKMNKSVEDIDGEILVISQFTLYGQVKKGTRPSFIDSAGPEKAEILYEKMIEFLEKTMPGKIQKGIFAANMSVSLINDGPVTIIIER